MTGVDVSVIVQWGGKKVSVVSEDTKKKLYARADGISLYIIRGQDVLGKCRKDGRSHLQKPFFSKSKSSVLNSFRFVVNPSSRRECGRLHMSQQYVVL